MYNLRVALDHTYFVGRATWGFSLWVHNDYFVRAVAGSEGKLWEIVFKDEAGVVGKGLKEYATKEAAERIAARANRFLASRAPRIFSEVIAGFTVLGNKRLVGSTLVIRITMFAGKATPASVRALAASFEKEALALGAKSIRIIGQAAGENVIRPTLFAKLGYVFKRIDQYTFEISKSL